MSAELREQIDALEQEIMEKNKQLAQLRRSLKQPALKEYQFTASDGSAVSLGDLFGEKENLVLIHNMGRQCKYCTMWADNYNGIFRYIRREAGFAVVSPDDHTIQREFGESRGWRFPMFSMKGTTLNKDLGFEKEDGGPMPGVTTLRKSGRDRYEVIAQAYFGPGDNFCSVYHFYDLLPVELGEL